MNAEAHGGSPQALAAAEHEAMAVVGRWSRAFAEADVDGIVALYAPDALFFGTSSTDLVTRPEGIRAYFEAALRADRPRTAVLVAPTARALSAGSVVVTGLDTVRDGRTMHARGRVSFVIVKRGSGWTIAHFHRSAVPGG